MLLPLNLFRGSDYSTVVTDSDGELLGARIADDGQWRFPPEGAVPEKYAKALINYEDRRFYFHPGIDPLAVARAIRQNLSRKEVVSGASTITMQVVRISRGRERSLKQKLIESLLALKLDFTHSKKQILALYAAHAPFGGNVVGLEAAAWRYFGRSAEELSWGEAATLAVLPNSPSAIYIGKNQKALKQKRDALLETLLQRKIIDTTTYQLSADEPLPTTVQELPQYAPHLVENFNQSAHGMKSVSSINLQLQKRVENVAKEWNNEYKALGIKDLAIVVLDVHTGDILAYVGNADFDRKRSGSQVDCARAPRSTGSILKPMLYCAMLQSGELMPNTLLADVPININGFSPQNFDMSFAGAVPASTALTRSLNVPSVRMLQTYGVPRFHELLKSAGLTTLNRPSSDYGLSLILGGGEGNLLEITSLYARMGREMQRNPFEGKNYTFPLYDRTAIWYTFEALKELNRPDELDLRMVSSVRQVAWKTGTSYGFRDAWAVGVTPDYAVGIWAGNAAGEGCQFLVGARTAGPVLFSTFNLLPSSGWFEKPFPQEYVMAGVCRQSGHLAGAYCSEIDTIMIPPAALRTNACPYHKPVLMDYDGIHRLNSPREGSYVENMFLLPPSMEYYYKKLHPEYVALPPLMSGSGSQGMLLPLEITYPENGAVILLPRQLDGSIKGMIATVAHAEQGAEIFWHLDADFIGSTKEIHQIELLPEPGHHSLTAVDQAGNSVSVGFDIKED